MSDYNDPSDEELPLFAGCTAQPGKDEDGRQHDARQGCHFDDQAAELARVGGRIGELIREFATDQGVGRQWHGADLLRYVLARDTCAPDSPGRILRDMREAGELDYEIINRRQSLYRFTRIE